MDKRQTKQHIEHASVFMRASVLECASVSLVRSRPSAAGTQVRTSCAYVAPPPPPPRAQSCNGSSRNKHRHTATVRIVAPPAPPPRALHFSFLTSLLILNTPFPRVHPCAIVGLVHEGHGSSRSTSPLSTPAGASAAPARWRTPPSSPRGSQGLSPCLRANSGRGQLLGSQPFPSRTVCGPDNTGPWPDSYTIGGGEERRRLFVYSVHTVEGQRSAITHHTDIQLCVFDAISSTSAVGRCAA